MKNGTCPKCGSDEIICDMPLRGAESTQPYIHMREPDPASKPFIWVPKSVRSEFTACVCGACGYTEFYATNFQALNEGRKNNFISS